MVSIDDDNINFNTLLNDLEESIEADRIYKLRNAAKIRAVNQPRTTYEDFESIVKGATLKPLSKKDQLNCNPRQTWNPVAKKLEEDSIDEVFLKRFLKK
ncbi:coiled-coil domain-containing protein 103 [Nephila pilipes]|uniref:Coiled-coil domain-containing protein 103 n=1 Tax=Nephila pilipes TaxID=299642 RepID=A0A8X6IWL6_NEPPI|nr:coiled-coil domain-containing protein 103 [Nephila pilipes]